MREINLKQQSPARALMAIVSAARAANEAAELNARLDAMDEADREADIADLLAS